MALVVSGTATFITLHGGHKEPVASLTVVDEPGTTPTPDVNLTQLASPSAEATAAPSTTADSRNSPDPADASGALPARCRGPLPPGHPADPSCDALHPHSGLPHPCIGIRYSCGWPDAHGAVPGGQTSMNVDVRGTTLHVTWTSEDLAGGRSQGPVHEFVIRLARPNTEDVLVTRRLPIDVFSTDFTGLAPGTYEVICYELNDSGLGAGFADTYTIAAPPTHPPLPSPTPKPTPTASAAPSATPTP
ncbi:MAG: hypothetical protein QOK42_2391 [Frankiaceae bacterium]|nr:hypothetical protein [Frankiaceae bacterium]